MAPPKRTIHAVEADEPETFCGVLRGEVCPRHEGWMEWQALARKHHVESRTWGVASFDICGDCWKVAHETRRYLG